MPDKFYTPVSIPRLPTNAEPADAGFVKLFSKDDGRMFSKDAEGNEIDLTNRDEIVELDGRADETDVEQAQQDNQLDAVAIVNAIQDQRLDDILQVPTHIEYNADRPLNVAFQISDASDVFVNYTIRATYTVTVNASTARVYLEISDDGTNFKEISRWSDNALLSLGGLLDISLLQSQEFTLTGLIPKGYFVRLTTDNSVLLPEAYTYLTGYEAHQQIKQLANNIALPPAPDPNDDPTLQVPEVDPDTGVPIDPDTGLPDAPEVPDLMPQPTDYKLVNPIFNGEVTSIVAGTETLGSTNFVGGSFKVTEDGTGFGASQVNFLGTSEYYEDRLAVPYVVTSYQQGAESLRAANTNGFDPTVSCVLYQKGFDNSSDTFTIVGDTSNTSRLTKFNRITNVTVGIQQQITLPEIQDSIQGGEFFPDQGYAVVQDGNGRLSKVLHIYSVQGTDLQTLQHMYSIEVASILVGGSEMITGCFSPDGKYFLGLNISFVIAGNEFELSTPFDLRTRTLTQSFLTGIEGLPTSCQYSFDGSRVYIESTSIVEENAVDEPAEYLISTVAAKGIPPEGTV